MADALPGKRDLKLYRGNTRHWTATFEDGDGPIDLTGHTWLCQIRADRLRGAVLATLTVDASQAATGTIQRTLSATEADALEPTDPNDSSDYYWWDLQSTSPSGDVNTWLAGKVTVQGDASHV